MTLTELKTQNDDILWYCEKFTSITPLEAQVELGIMRLAARINELEKRGYSFRHELVEFKSRHGRIGHYMRYTLEGLQ